MQLNVTILNPAKIIFNGKAGNVILPGEEGVFEILPYHKPIMSRLISGILYVGEDSFSVQRGIVRSYKNNVVIIMEESP